MEALIISLATCPCNYTRFERDSIPNNHGTKLVALTFHTQHVTHNLVSTYTKYS